VPAPSGDAIGRTRTSLPVREFAPTAAPLWLPPRHALSAGVHRPNGFQARAAARILEPGGNDEASVRWRT